jgi:hypothetical protein
MFVHNLGNVGGEDDLEAKVSDLPAHDVFGVSIKCRARVEHLWTCAGTALFGKCGFAAGDDDCCGAVAEEAAGDQIGDGLVVVLPGEGAELDGEKERVLVGEGADVVGGA